MNQPNGDAVLIVPLEVIEPIMSDEKSTWTEKFRKIVAYKRSCGLRGFHATFYQEDGKELDAEQYARCLCLSELANSRGDYTEVNGFL